MQIVEGYEFLKFILQTLDTEVPTTSPNHVIRGAFSSRASMFVSLNLLKIDILRGVEVDEYIANTAVF